MAAGITVANDRLEAFRAFVETTLAPAVEAARRADVLLIDGAVTAAGAHPELIATMARAGPFGPGNPEPVVVLPGHVVAHAEPAGLNHIRARLRSGEGGNLQAIAFRAAGQPLGEALLASRGRSIHAAGTLLLDRHQGDTRAQLRLIDVAATDAAAA